MDYLSKKIETFEGINNNPVAPTAEQAGNGSHLIAQLNDLIDDVQLESDANLESNVIANGLFVLPLLNGIRITAGQYIDSNKNIYNINQQDVSTGFVADTAEQFVILNYQTGIAKIEQNTYVLIANEIKLATISTQLPNNDHIRFNNDSLGSINLDNPLGLQVNFTHPTGLIKNDDNIQFINGKQAGFNFDKILIEIDLNGINYYKTYPITNQITIPNINDYTQGNIDYKILNNIFEENQIVTGFGQIFPDGTLTGNIEGRYGYVLTSPNIQVIEIEHRNLIERISNNGGHKRKEDFQKDFPLKFSFPLNESFVPFISKNNGLKLDGANIIYSSNANFENNIYSKLDGYSLDLFKGVDNNNYSTIYLTDNYTYGGPYLYMDNCVNGNSEWCLDLRWGDFVLYGLNYEEKIKLTIDNNGEIYINGIKVLGERKTVISDLNVTATSGSLPVDAQSLTIENASTPTVQELLKYCTYLKQQVTDLKTQLKSHGLIV